MHEVLGGRRVINIGRKLCQAKFGSMTGFPTERASFRYDDEASVDQRTNRASRRGFSDVKLGGRLPNRIWKAAVVRSGAGVAHCHVHIDRSGCGVQALPSRRVHHEVHQPDMPA
jgi:hypothetical protein